MRGQFGGIAGAAQVEDNLIQVSQSCHASLIHPCPSDLHVPRAKPHVSSMPMASQPSHALISVLCSDQAGSARFGQGFALFPRKEGAACFGHAGVGGSVAFADPEHGISVAITLNRLGGDGRTTRAIVHEVSNTCRGALGFGEAGLGQGVHLLLLV